LYGVAHPKIFLTKSTLGAIIARELQQLPTSSREFFIFGALQCTEVFSVSSTLNERQNADLDSAQALHALR